MFTIEIEFRDGSVLSRDANDIRFSRDEVIIFDEERAIKLSEIQSILLKYGEDIDLMVWRSNGKQVTYP